MSAEFDGWFAAPIPAAALASAALWDQLVDEWRQLHPGALCGLAPIADAALTENEGA